MRYSKALIPTLKESPADTEAISHKLMIRAGLIRQLIAGAYSYLPLAFKVLKKIEDIVRREMDNAGAQQMLMPALQPVDLWLQTGRYDLLGDELVKFKDRSGKEMVIGPTHEEVVTDIARRELHSYKDLPKILYQIQTKLRDEPRPRFGIIRTKEFIMKDAYSFDRDAASLDISYKKMFETYKRIFEGCGLDAIAVEADSGFMGGNESAEFMVLSDSGEDIVCVCNACGYKSSLVKIKCVAPEAGAIAKQDKRQPKEVDTPGVSSIEKVSEFLKCKPLQMIKTLIYMANGKPAAVLVRGDHDVNEAKLAGVLNAKDLRLADGETIQNITGAPLGFAGPCGLKGVKLVIDHAVAFIVNGVTGANKRDKHLINITAGVDFPVTGTVDIRYITEGEPCPKCRRPISLKKAIEVGHVFKLGTKYSDSMNAEFLDSDGKRKPFIMGCYGIGINRIMAAAVEQNNDKDGIIWPLSIAPFQVIILSLGAGDDVAKASSELYENLLKQGIEVLFDDRDISPGVKFKDADLIGIPLQIIIGAKGLAKGILEFKIRKESAKNEVKVDSAADEVKKTLTSLGVL